MFRSFEVSLLLFVFLLQCSSLLPTVGGIECVDESIPKTRVFKSLAEFQANKIQFYPMRGNSQGNSQGNYVAFSGSINGTLLRNSFVALDSQHIRKISLDNNEIRGIEDEAFLSLNCTAILSLRRNKIDEISKYMFTGLSHLHELDLGENDIKEIQEYTFGSTLGLKKLNLTRNSIRVMRPDSFYKLFLLEELDLSYNHLKRILPVTFQYFGNLVNLQLGSNLFEQLDVYKWQNLTKLKFLNLSDNSLSSFDFSSPFSFGSSLEQLYLDDNLLTGLNHVGLRKHLSALKIIDISENLWICGNLAPILRVLNDSHIQYRGPEFLSDPNMNGIACNRSDTYKKTTQIDEEIEITTIAEIVRPSSAVPHVKVEEPAVHAVYVTNMKILDSISSLQTVTVCLFVIVLIFILAEVVVRTGCLNVIVRRRRGVVLDDADVENFSLLRERF